MSMFSAAESGESVSKDTYEAEVQRKDGQILTCEVRGRMTNWQGRQLRVSVLRDLTELDRRQNRDGGFGLWRRGEESWPFVSVQVAHAVQRAKEKGFEVPEQLETRCRRYLPREGTRARRREPWPSRRPC